MAADFAYFAEVFEANNEWLEVRLLEQLVHGKGRQAQDALRGLVALITVEETTEVVETFEPHILAAHGLRTLLLWQYDPARAAEEMWANPLYHENAAW